MHLNTKLEHSGKKRGQFGGNDIITTVAYGAIACAAIGVGLNVIDRTKQGTKKWFERKKK